MGILKEGSLGTKGYLYFYSANAHTIICTHNNYYIYTHIHTSMNTTSGILA